MQFVNKKVKTKVSIYRHDILLLEVFSGTAFFDCRTLLYESRPDNSIKFSCEQKSFTFMLNNISKAVKIDGYTIVLTELNKPRNLKLISVSNKKQVIEGASETVKFKYF